MCLIDIGDVRDEAFIRLTLPATGLFLKLRLWAAKRETIHIDIPEFRRVLNLDGDDDRRQITTCLIELCEAEFCLNLGLYERIQLPPDGMKIVRNDPRLAEWVDWWQRMHKENIVSRPAPDRNDRGLRLAWTEAIAGPNASLIGREMIQHDIEYELRQSDYLRSRQWFDLKALLNGSGKDQSTCMSKILAGDYRPARETTGDEDTSTPKRSSDDDIETFAQNWWTYFTDKRVTDRIDLMLNRPARLIRKASYTNDEIAEAKRVALDEFKSKINQNIMTAIDQIGGLEVLLKSGDGLRHVRRDFFSAVKGVIRDREQSTASS